MRAGECNGDGEDVPSWMGENRMGNCGAVVRVQGPRCGGG